MHHDPSTPINRVHSLQTALTDRISGQDEVIASVAASALASLQGENSLKQPYSKFLALGSSGSGKVELTRTFSSHLFGESSPAENHYIRFDMSEYQTASSLGRLLGTQANDCGTLGLAHIRAKGYGTIVFDEIEKAHETVFKVLIHILFNRYVTLADARDLFFNRFFIFATSNICSHFNGPPNEAKRHAYETASAWFRPEVVSKFHNVLVFNKLPDESGCLS